MTRKTHPELTHVSATMQAFYRHVSRKYALSEHHRRLLVCACEAHSRMAQAQAMIAAEGLTTVDRHGQARPHPAIAIETASRVAFMRGLRELSLADDDLPADARPPRLRGYQGRGA